MAMQQTQVQVLLLGFEYTDIEELNEEANEVNRAFSSKGYQVINYLIKMNDPWHGEEGLHRTLNTFFSGDGDLRILYYHGHGSFSFVNGLELHSHGYPDNIHTLHEDANKLWNYLKNDSLTAEEREKITHKYERYQDITSLFWGWIRKLVMAAKYHVLVILDCCYAGGSLALVGRGLNGAIQAPNPGAIYAKESLSAASWGSATYGKYSSALCKALNQWETEMLLVEELHGNMTEILEKEGEEKEKKISKKENELQEKIKSLKERRDNFKVNSDKFNRNREHLLSEKEAKQEALTKATERAKPFKYYEPTPSKKSQMENAITMAKKEAEDLRLKIKNLDKDIERHNKEKGKLDEEEKKLDSEGLILDRDIAELKEEVDQLTQPLYTRLYKSIDGNRPQITLPNLTMRRG